MAFDLEVSFTGLCLFLIRDDCSRVAVVQPDCRVGGLDPQHPDGDPEPGEHHVGYLRYNLANLVPGFPAGNAFNGPVYEVIHRFSGEEVNFGLAHVDVPMTINTRLPAMERIAPDPANPQPPSASECGHGERSLLGPVQGLFGTNAPLVSRMVFSGGELTGSRTATFEFPTAFNPGAASTYAGNFARTVTWTRTVADADQLKLTITPFDGGPSQHITLQPVTIGNRQVISLKIANLCTENPLEWPEFPAPVAAQVDRDFKWLYRLLEAAGAQSPATLLNGAQFPVPTIPAGFGGMGGENCIGTRITVTGF